MAAMAAFDMVVGAADGFLFNQFVYRRFFQGEPAEDREEEQFYLEIATKVAFAYITHPLMTAKTLIQLGYEPFPPYYVKTLTGGYTFVLPDVFTYAFRLADSHPAPARNLSFDASALAVIAGLYATRWTTRYLDVNLPEMEFQNDEDVKSLGQAFWRMLRYAIRESGNRIVAVIVARPFTVVCIRQIAQLVGGEAKYLHVRQAISLILEEEGVGGLFAGLVPQLVAELVMVWSCHVVAFTAERAIVRLGLHKDLNICVQTLLALAIKYILSPVFHPYSIVSTVMTCAGSGLAVSLLPHHPPFGHWHDCYEYLRPHGLKRGASLFFRETSVVGYAANRMYLKIMQLVG